MEVTQRQASQALETVQELSKAETAQAQEAKTAQAQGAKLHTNEARKAREKSAGNGAVKPVVNGDHAAMRFKKAQQDIVLVVGDFNIDPLVATCSNPENVTDVVIHIGTNDKQKAMTAQEAKDGIGRFQSKYKRCFKKACFHIAALPPTSDKQEVNFHLRELAAEKKSNFISLKTMKDRQTRQEQSRQMGGPCPKRVQVSCLQE